uniref:NADH dehydrogenase subunit 11 n=1 Tax=Storeatula sp. CCMP1868 TaxID=195070 RepID=A0A2P1G886_9CRYP|nr:NADH dehydrogenase subunit 11 [Storeatula sp. CCMP1868]AVM81174.1 NADH dehydrogenase subunit 11 [Storeatula sp. CCMP1868]
MNTINVFINDFPIKVKSNISVLEGCNQNGFEISRFCFHEKLFVAGNCRMCLVEIKGQAKLSASCAVYFTEGMHILTNSSVVKKARESILEFLLVNHPLDCPICDQGGECDLQDQSFFYGSDKSRFFEYKRAVSNKNCGPLVKTIMNRCIQCTRCVRFANDVIGFSSLGTVGRGSQIEISFYIRKLFFSELSGNIIDICPVGALTSKPSAFSTRPWEMKSVRSVDVFDGFGSNIRIDSRNLEILRILPYKNDFINEEWVSDKIRFGFDTLKRQRLNKPYFKSSINFYQLAWTEILNVLSKKLDVLNKKNLPFYLIIGAFCDLKTAFAAKYLLKISANFSSIINFEGYGLTSLDFQHFFCFNNRFQILNDKNLEGCFLVSVDPRKEAPVLNLKLRKQFIKRDFLVANLGSRLNLTFPIFQLTINSFKFLNVIAGKHLFCKFLRKIEKSIAIIGSAFLNVTDENNNRFFLAKFLINSKIINSKFFGLNILSSRATDVAIYNLGLKTKILRKSSKPKFLFVLGDTVFQKDCINTFVCFQGIQGNELLIMSNVVLPSCAFTEKNSLFINIEGRFQNSQKAVSMPKNSKLDFDIILSILNLFDLNLMKKFKKNFLLSQNKIPFYKNNQNPFFSLFSFPVYMTQIKLVNKTFISIFNQNYYQNNLLLKNSITMAKSSKMLLTKSPFV